MRQGLLLLLLFLTPPVWAQDVSPAPEKTTLPAKPSITQIDETRFKVGDVTFDQKSREIRFPATVNMTEGLLEFLIVHENGKLHESLLSTRISPTDLNLAFTLLRYKPSPELYPLPNATGGTSSNYPKVPDDIQAAARIKIDIEWTDEGQTRRVTANDWIQHDVKTTAMPPGPWVYGGSVFEDGKFSPELTGDLAAIFANGFSLIVFPGSDNHDDTVWVPFSKRVAKAGTNVTVIIAPYLNPPPVSKP
jgi:hypothetical protein